MALVASTYLPPGRAMAQMPAGPPTVVGWVLSTLLRPASVTVLMPTSPPTIGNTFSSSLGGFFGGGTSGPEPTVGYPTTT